MEISLFGPLEVRIDGQSLNIRPSDAKWLLASLVLNHGRDWSRQALADFLWQDTKLSDSQRRVCLRTRLYDLRKCLGKANWRLRAVRDTLRFDVADLTIDVLEYDSAVRSTDERRLEGAISQYEKGPLLDGCKEWWVDGERHRRAEAYVRALETLADRRRERSEVDQAIVYWRRAVQTDLRREDIACSLMRLLHERGRLLEVVEFYTGFRDELNRVCDARPKQETQDLYKWIVGDRRPIVVPPTRRPDPDPSFDETLRSAINADRRDDHFWALNLARKARSLVSRGTEEYARASNLLAIIYDHEHMWREAKRVLKEVIEDKPALHRYGNEAVRAEYQYAVVLVREAEAALASRKPAVHLLNQADQSLKTLCANAPDEFQTSIMHQSGIIDLLRNEFESAKAVFQECQLRRVMLLDDDKLIYDLRRLANVLAHLRQQEEAVTTLRSALARARLSENVRYCRLIEKDLAACLSR